MGQGIASPPGLTPSQKAALDANTLLDAVNYVAGIDDTAGGSGGGGFTVSLTSFAYDTASPVTLQTVATSETVCKIILDITTAFDQVSSLSVGHTGSSDALMAAVQNNTQTAGYYEVAGNHQYGGADTVKLYITPGLSTQGAGKAWVITKKA